MLKNETPLDKAVKNVKGIMKWYDVQKGYGFIDVELQGKHYDVFFHWSDINKHSSAEKITDGIEAKFDLILGDGGRLKALNVIFGERLQKDYAEIKRAFCQLLIRQGELEAMRA